MTRRCVGRGVPESSKSAMRHLHGVAGTALLGLEDESNTGGGDRGPYALGLVSDDAVDVLGGDALFWLRR